MRSLMLRVLALAIAALAGVCGEARAADPLIKQLRCMRDAVYTEARGQPELGQLMVAHVIYVRARGDRTKFCDEVYKQYRKKDGTRVSQFSGPVHHPVTLKDDDPRLLQASLVAVRVGLGHFVPPEHLRCASNYLNPAGSDPVRLRWFGTLRFAGTVKDHNFYCPRARTASR